jgi:hypothetical protein
MPLMTLSVQHGHIYLIAGVSWVQYGTRSERTTGGHL